MMLPAGVVQSIDANTVDLDNAWIFADADIWSQDYSEVLLQPISVEAVDINDLRFKATEVVLDANTCSTKPPARAQCPRTCCKPRVTAAPPGKPPTPPKPAPACKKPPASAPPQRWGADFLGCCF